MTNLIDIYTQQELDTFRLHLEELLTDISGGASDEIDLKLKLEHYPSTFTFYISESLANVVNRADGKVPRSEVISALSELKSKLNSLNSIEVTLSFDPSPDFISHIHSIFKKDYMSSGEFVLDIKTDPSIIEGVVFAVDGKYYDYSYADKIESFDFSGLKTLGKFFKEHLGYE